MENGSLLRADVDWKGKKKKNSSRLETQRPHPFYHAGGKCASHSTGRTRNPTAVLMCSISKWKSQQ